MDLGIKGKTAIVTAASRGIGRAVAETLAYEGVNVVMCARGEAALREAARQVSAQSGVRVIPHPADVTVAADIRRLAQTANEEFGGVDILVAIGGSPPRGTLAETTEEQLRAGFEMTVMPVFWLVSEVLPYMRRKRWGRIVAVQARSVREPIPSLTVSNATRPGAAGLLKSIANEVARDGVSLNTLLPGRIMTERFHDGARKAGVSVEEHMRSQSLEIPMQRLGEAREMADAVAFLVSNRASYITGVTLAVDGGLIRHL